MYARVYMLSLNREHSKSQHGKAQSPLQKAANQVRADQSTHQKKYVRTCILRPVCFRGTWSSWQLQVASLQLQCWALYLLHICHPNPFSLLSERSGRNHPVREAPWVYCTFDRWLVAQAGTGSNTLPCWYWTAADPQITPRRLMVCGKGPLMWAMKTWEQYTSESSGGERSERVGQAHPLPPCYSDPSPSFATIIVSTRRTREQQNLVGVLE